MKLLTTAKITLLCLAVTPSAQAINFNFITTGMSSQATAALNLAGSSWSSKLLDPVTINITVNMTNLNDTRVIGNASSIDLQSSYTPLRNLLVSDAANEANDGIVKYLPTANQFSAYLPTGITTTGYLLATKADLKALGETNLDSLYGINDGTINFNSGFAFDYDASNGITSGTMDFETVAAHEIGHILGFVSIVDEIDAMLAKNQTGAITPYLLDLFRFGTNAVPTTTAEFSTMSRDLRPGVASYFNDLSVQVPFSTGYLTGDGNQASHWKDSSTNLWGIMDPTLAYGQIAAISSNDLRALDLIGYEITAVPLPSAIWFFSGSLLAWFRLVRRTKVTANSFA
ncbi:MAG: NF038122 family metalloprotease [Methylococcaceae bacterium]